MIGMGIFSIQISVSGVAWYGAIVATVSGFIGYLNYRRERECVRVKYQRGMIVPNTPGYDIKKRYFIVDSVNLSTRPVTIKMVGGMNFDGSGFILSESLHGVQVTIDGGKNYVVVTEESAINWSDVEYFATYSVTGKTYKAYVPSWRARLRRKLKKLFFFESKKNLKI